jgi:hypothetical protein
MLQCRTVNKNSILIVIIQTNDIIITAIKIQETPSNQSNTNREQNDP